MAKALSEQLLELLDADTQAKVRAALQSKPELIVRDAKSRELLDLFYGEDEPAAVTTPPAAAVHVPTVPSAASTTSSASSAAAPTVTATPNPPAATTGTSDSMAAVLAELQGLKAKLDKDFIPVSKLPEYRAEILTLAIKSADDYATVRENHRAEFNESLDRSAFEKFVADQAAAGVRHANMSAAHDAFVKDKRVAAQAAAEKAKIDAAVAEALKQARSAGSVPGQTQSVAQSPAQEIMAKAKAAANGGNAESAAMRAARQLEELDRNRASVH